MGEGEERIRKKNETDQGEIGYVCLRSNRRSLVFFGCLSGVRKEEEEEERVHGEKGGSNLRYFQESECNGAAESGCESWGV